MYTITIAVGMALTFAGCACLYLASPRQLWLKTPLCARPARVAAGILSIGGLTAFIQAMYVVPAVFTFITWVMLLLVIFPYIGAAISSTRRGR